MKSDFIDGETKWYSIWWLIFWFLVCFPVAFLYIIIKYGNVQRRVKGGVR